MIHIINKYNSQLYEEVLDDMFRLRHEIFVEQKGWEKLRKADGRDLDEFDTDNATYILKLSPNRQILGGMRLYPTTGPTQLNSLFSEACVLAPQPSGPNDYEWSRYFIADAHYRSAQGKPVHMELYAGILEFAVAKGISSLSGYIEVGTFIRSRRMPWDMIQLGIPTEYGGNLGEPKGYGLPTLLNINSKMLKQTRRLWHLLYPVLSLSLGVRALGIETGFQAKDVLAVNEALSCRETLEEFEHLVNELISLSHTEISSRKLRSTLFKSTKKKLSLSRTKLDFHELVHCSRSSNLPKPYAC